MSYTGFIYLWFNRVEKRYYLGSHYGTIDDGYIGSGIYFRRSYDLFPENFKRRILEYTNGNKQQLLKLESKWLSLIKDSEIANKYYNLNKLAGGGSPKGRKLRPLTEEHKQKLRKPKSKETIEKMRKPKTLEHKKKISTALKIKCENEDRSGQNNAMFGKKHSIEAKQLQSLKAYQRKKIPCICGKEYLPAHARYHVNCSD